MENSDKFNVVVLGIIFNPETRKILIGRRENDPDLPELNWCFPGGRLIPGKKCDNTLKEKIKLKTGYNVKNLGTIFSRVYPNKQDLLQIYFLCEIFEGDEKPGDDLVELKWVKPEEVEKYFKGPFNTRLKEYIMNLKKTF
ncbi:NUDIX domain-containing protein [Candidatus Pacearchaeota archaeon]|nr:NUDIX domain-containing protein [Candidatus Pacearchaeota archaeon]